MNLTSNGLTRQMLDFYEDRVTALEGIAERVHIDGGHDFAFRFCAQQPCASFRAEFEQLAAEREEVIYLDLRTSGSGLKA
jgi:hypothetical protein